MPTVVTSAVSNLVLGDINLIAGGIATFVVTGVLTWLGIRQGKAKVIETAQAAPVAQQTIVGATIMENMTMRELTRALDEHTIELRINSHEVERNTQAVALMAAAMTRATDIALISRRSAGD